MNLITLSEQERHYLLNALEYFKKEEKNEIRELMLPGGNRDYIPECEKRLKIFESLITKCNNNSSWSIKRN